MRSDPEALGDLHSHLTPGVDDGARSMDEALEAVEAMTRMGIRRIITTPHLDASLLEDPARADRRIKKIQSTFRSLAVKVREQFPEVVLWRGFEVMLDLPDPDLSDARVRMAGTRFVLVEWPRLQVPPGTEQVVARIRRNGWLPIIAHPERYHGLDAELVLPRRWRDAGAFLQVNHGSLTGQYGSSARQRGLRLLELGAVDYLSSDYHPRPGHPLQVKGVRELFREAEALDSFHMLNRTNPQRVMDDKEPLSAPPLELRGGLLSRLGDFLGPKR